MPDDYLFAYYGWRTSEGARPYLDVWDHKPPGIWWVNALGFVLCGTGRAAELLICSAALACVLGGTLTVVRLACGPGALLPAAFLAAPVLTALGYECGANRTETFVAASDALGVALYLRAVAACQPTSPRARRRLISFAAAGLALGVGVWFKQTGAAAPLACAAHAIVMWLWIGRARPMQPAAVSGPEVGWLMGGIAAPGVAALAVLWANEAISAAWQAVVVHNRAYFQDGDASWTAIPHAVRQYLPWLGPLAPLGAAAACLWVVCAVYRASAPGSAAGGGSCAGGEARPSFYPHAVGVIGLWFLLSAYLICVATGRQNYHLAPVLTPAVLLTVLPLGLSRAFGGGLGRSLQHPVAACLSVLLAASGGAVLAADWPSLCSIWGGKPNWWALTESAPRSEQALADRVRSLTRDDESLFVWGWNPGVYRFAYRVNAVRFATNEQAQHAGASAAWMEDEVEATLMARPPAAFVISEGEWRGLCAARPGLTSMIVGAYRYVETLHDKRIYVRISPASASAP